jgi:hypothetical protein
MGSQSGSEPRARRSWLPPADVRGQFLGVAARLGATGLLAIGGSAILALGMDLAFGESFVAGDPPEITYSKARCADYLEYEPNAGTCEQAATLHHFGEVVQYQGAAGVLGAVVLAAYLWARRRWRWMRERRALPPGFEATIGASMFGLAALGLLGEAANALMLGGRTGGAGSFLSAGIVSLVVAAAYGHLLYRTLSPGWAAAGATT